MTGSHAASERAWPIREWRVGDPFFNIPDALSSNRSATWVVPEGFAKNGTWISEPLIPASSGSVQRLGRLHIPHSDRKPAHFPSADFANFDASDKAHRGWFGTHLVVVLVP